MFIKFFTAFEGEDEAAAAAAAAKAKAEADAAGDVTFTQDQVNTYVAEERRKLQTKQRELALELDNLKRNASLTEEEKTSLEKRIEELQSQSMTAEEKARRENDRSEKEYTEQIENLTVESKLWQSKHEQLMIDTVITKAAADAKALFVEQISAILIPKTKLTEKLDDEGKPTGEYEPKVQFPDKDKDEKLIILELTVEEAVKRMKELPQYQNLFEDGMKGGLGGTGSDTTGAKIDMKKIAKEDPAQYRKLRKERPDLVRNAAG